MLHKPLPYGGVQCCGTAYPALDPVPRVSVILQYYKMAPNIDPLASWKDCPGVEFIVNVDSTDALDTKWLNTSADHVVFSRNIHESRAYNRLAGVSRAPITLFVQDDDAPPSDCRYVDHVEKMFGHDPKLAVVGFNVGTNTPWGHVWQSPDGPVNHIRSHDAKHKWGLGNIAAEYAACVDIGPFAVRRRDFLAMGGFDESFSYPGKGAVGLDFDVATRAWLSAGKGRTRPPRWAPNSVPEPGVNVPAAPAVQRHIPGITTVKHPLYPRHGRPTVGFTHNVFIAFRLSFCLGCQPVCGTPPRATR